MKYYFIYNPIAGRGEKGVEFLKNFEVLKTKFPDSVFLSITSRCGEATEIAESICLSEKGNEITIFACGGDGTMNEVVNGIVGFENVSFGIVPTGSCNDFLKCNIFNGYNFLDIEKQINGYSITMDIMKAGNTYSLNVTNIGFDAKVNADQIKYRNKFKTVKQAYNYAILVNAFKKLGDHVKVVCDDKIYYEGDTLLMAFCNGAYYGGGYNCAPESLQDDGLIDLFLVKKVSVLKFASLVKKYKKGELYNNPKYSHLVQFVRGKKFSIISNDVLTICIDGETIYQKEIDIELLKHHIKFHFPEK